MQTVFSPHGKLLTIARTSYDDVIISIMTMLFI